MLNDYDCVAVLAYKIIKDNDIFKKIDFTKDELTDYFSKVVNKYDEEFDYKTITDKHIFEIRDSLEGFCKFENELIILNEQNLKQKARRRASMYVQGLSFPLLCSCIETYAEELKLKKDNSNSL